MVNRFKIGEIWTVQPGKRETVTPKWRRVMVSKVVTFTDGTVDLVTMDNVDVAGKSYGGEVTYTPSFWEDRWEPDDLPE